MDPLIVLHDPIPCACVGIPVLIATLILGVVYVREAFRTRGGADQSH